MIVAALACRQCSNPFEGPPHQRYCSTRCKDRARHSREMTRPEVVLRRRAKCLEWAATHRGVTKRNAWLAGQIPYVGHLPGGGSDLSKSRRGGRGLAGGRRSGSGGSE